MLHCQGNSHNTRVLLILLFKFKLHFKIWGTGFNNKLRWKKKNISSIGRAILSSLHYNRQQMMAYRKAPYSNIIYMLSYFPMSKQCKEDKQIIFEARGLHIEKLFFQLTISGFVKNWTQMQTTTVSAFTVPPFFFLSVKRIFLLLVLHVVYCEMHWIGTHTSGQMHFLSV